MNNPETKVPHQLVDWQEFEIFIAELYQQGEQVTVKHNVTEIGKSGAKRQIDVLVKQRTLFHELKIIIECKCWKTKVDRQVIDVLFSSVEDLNANKGVIFTTKGFEQGAVSYAKSKNIDIFVVRDLTEADWGRPGKNFLMYLQIYSGAIKNIQFENLYFVSANGQGPESTSIDIGIHFNEQELSNEKFNLVALDSTKSKVHLVKLFRQTHMTLLKQLSAGTRSCFEPKEEAVELGYKTPIAIDFKYLSQKFLKHEHGYIGFDAITFDFYQTVSQSRIAYDRSSTAVFILMVENYISDKKYYATKNKLDDSLKLMEARETIKVPDEEVWQNGDVLKVQLDFTVDGTPGPAVKILKTPLRNISWTVIDSEILSL